MCAINVSVANMAVLAVLLLLAVLPPAHPAAPVCLWNTTAAHIAGLPGCCGWPDGCSYKPPRTPLTTDLTFLVVVNLGFKLPLNRFPEKIHQHFYLFETPLHIFVYCCLIQNNKLPVWL